MDLATTTLGLLAIGTLLATAQAWRLGNERRDVRLMGVLTGLLGAGTLATATL